MRIKVRYILARISYPDEQPDTTINVASISKALQLTLQYQFGVWGSSMGRSNFHVRYYNLFTGICIIRVPRQAVYSVAYSLANMSKLHSQSCQISILHISGTIKKCQLNAIELSRHILRQCTENELENTLFLADDGQITGSKAIVAQASIIEKEILAIEDVTDS